MCVCVCLSEVNPPHRVSVSAIGTENVTMCWEQLHDDEVDAHHIQLRPHTQELSQEFWVNSSDCIILTMLVPGETYDVGVSTERGRNRSLEKTLQLTLSKNQQFFFFPIFFPCITVHPDIKAMHVVYFMLLEPQMVQDAVPYTVDTDFVVLFVQMPTSSVYDGLAVAYSRNSTWIPMSRSTSKAVVGNLSPGTVYEFQLFVTSRGMSSDGFTLLPVRTCEWKLLEGNGGRLCESQSRLMKVSVMLLFFIFT